MAGLRSVWKNIVQHCNACDKKRDCKKWVGPACVMFGGTIEPQLANKDAIIDLTVNNNER